MADLMIRLRTGAETRRRGPPSWLALRGVVAPAARRQLQTGMAWQDQVERDDVESEEGTEGIRSHTAHTDSQRSGRARDCARLRESLCAGPCTVQGTPCI